MKKITQIIFFLLLAGFVFFVFVTCGGSGGGAISSQRGHSDDDAALPDDDTIPADDDDNDDSAATHPTWISIPAGTYEMGCVPQDHDCQSWEKPRHQVTLSAFQITKSHVTQAQYQAVTGNNPSHFQPPQYSPCPDCPVEQVHWSDALAFCTAVGGRLPTEAEWEYAARAGTETIYICGDDRTCLDSVAWDFYNSKGTHPVCEKTVNAWGLCDMTGNATEWLNDWYDGNYYSTSPANDPPGPTSGTGRVVRGESFWGTDFYLRASWRYADFPYDAQFNIGFRCARDVAPDDDDNDDNDSSPSP